ncbi:MAG: hypothetical protein K9G11_03380 [Rickettsiaceae bacterium]|nr:hypothetical protein [Rickettsiaceae bacterium]
MEIEDKFVGMCWDEGSVKSVATSSSGNAQVSLRAYKAWQSRTNNSSTYIFN